MQLMLVMVGIAGSFAAQAAYEFTNVDPPGSLFTQVFGVNNSGQAVGTAISGAGEVNFSYDIKKGSFTTLTPAAGYAETGLLGINDAGATAGNVVDGGGFNSGAVRSKTGAYTVFAHPDCDNTNGRAIGNTGLVTGFADTCASYDSVGFIYDPASGNFTDFLASSNSLGVPTIPQGINGKGQVVGSVFLEGTDAPAGDGVYGFLRNATGAIILFRVNGVGTRARGISDSGLITGFVNTPDGPKGFVVSLAPDPSYQTFTIADADLLSYPSPDAVATFAQGITNSGIISGSWDEFLGGDPDDPANYTMHGFIATPVPPKKK